MATIKIIDIAENDRVAITGDSRSTRLDDKVTFNVHAVWDVLYFEISIPTYILLKYYRTGEKIWIRNPIRRCRQFP